MQHPNAVLTTLSKMTLKPEVTCDKLFQKLYNVELWLLAYQRIAPKPGNMTPGVDGKTIDGTGLKLIQEAIADLKASRYKPIPVRRVYIPKPNGKQRPLGIPIVRSYCPPYRVLSGFVASDGSDLPTHAHAPTFTVPYFPQVEKCFAVSNGAGSACAALR